MSQHSLAVPNTPADWQAVYQQLLAENESLRSAREEIEERAEKRMSLLKQQIAQRKEAEAALQRERGLIKLLQEVAVAANEAEGVDSVLQFTLDKICEYMDWPIGYVYVGTRDNSGDLVLSGLWFCRDERFQAQRNLDDRLRIVAGQGWLGEVLQNGQSRWQPEANWEAGQAYAGFAMPVLVGTEVAAILEFWTADETPPADDLLGVMQHIAIQLGRVVERVRAARALRHSEAMLSEAQRLAHLGSWEWDVNTNEVLWSTELHRIHGTDSQTFVVSYDEFLARVYADDRPMVAQVVQEALLGQRLFAMFYRIVRPDGEVRVLHGRGQPVWDAAGNLVRMVGTGQDVTEQKEIEAQLIETQQRARQTAETLRAANIALTETLHLPTVLAALLEQLADLAPYDRGSILLRRSANTVSVQAVRGYAADHPSLLRGRLLQIDWFPHLAAVINQKQTFYIRDTATHPDWRPHLEGVGEVRSWLGIPLVAGGQVIGLCSLNHKEPDYFTEENRLLAEALAGQAAIAVQNARWFTELRTSREQLRLVTKQVVTVQEQERQRVSRELHDEAGQSLTALKMSLDLIRADLPDALKGVEQSLVEAIELTDETMERIRLLAHDLRPPALDALGLDSALESLCHEVAVRAHLPISYEGCDLPPLTDEIAISLYRFVQEALTNVLKHAQASQVQVLLRHDVDNLYLVVADDGQGFQLVDPEEPAGNGRASGGLGLAGMMERLALLGGELKIESEPGRGARLMAQAPLLRAEAGV